MVEAKVSQKVCFSQILTGSALLCGVTQLIAVIPHRRFETTYRYHLQDPETQEIQDFLTLEDGALKLSRKVCKKLLLYAA
jgi:hypothetical protein